MSLDRQRDVHDMLTEPLKENLEDDPYGTVSYIIAGMLELALDDGRSGTMSETEFEALEALARLFMMHDPHLEIEPRIA